MKAVVYDRPGRFAVRDLPDPQPGPRDVLLRVLMAGVCGTDLHLHVGEFGPTYPLVPGHEIVGEVVGLGAEVSRLRPGRRVVLDNTTSCGACIECRRARPAFCRHLIAQGVNAPGALPNASSRPRSDVSRSTICPSKPRSSRSRPPASCMVSTSSV